MSLQNIILGSYGYDLVLEILDTDTEQAEDISGYSSFAVDISDPDGNVATKAATLYTDGTDGKVKYTTAVSDIDESGQWKIRAKVYTGSTIVLYSTWVQFFVPY